MNEIVFLSPEGSTAKPNRKPLKTLESMQGRRVGFLWGMHDLSTKFWPAFEKEVVDLHSPREVHHHYKHDTGDGKFHGNTWIPSPISDIQEMATQIDCAITGVGA
jgi:hypothetical protein